MVYIDWRVYYIYGRNIWDIYLKYYVFKFLVYLMCLCLLVLKYRVLEIV